MRRTDDASGKTGLQFLVVLLVLFQISISAAQDSTKSQISVSAAVSSPKVALNRTIELKVTISWLGDADRYDVIEFNNPALTNFEILATSTTSRTELNQVFKDYTYTLKPSELGMGYIEGVIVKAHDKIRDKDEHILTQRLPVEITDPVPEPGENNFPYLIVMPALVVIVSVAIFYLWNKKRKQKLQERSVEPETPIEVNYLEELKSTIDLNQPNLRDDFSRLTKLLRNYLKEKFNVKALEATTNEIGSVLAETDFEENQINSVREILTRSDEIKFSGSEGSKEELNRFYTLVEGLLESYLRKFEADQNVVEEKK